MGPDVEGVSMIVADVLSLEQRVFHEPEQLQSKITQLVLSFFSFCVFIHLKESLFNILEQFDPYVS